MISLIDKRRGVSEAEPFCRLLPIASSTYYVNITKRLDVDRLSTSSALRWIAMNAPVAFPPAKMLTAVQLRKLSEPTPNPQTLRSGPMPGPIRYAIENATIRLAPSHQRTSSGKKSVTWNSRTVLPLA